MIAETPISSTNLSFKFLTGLENLILVLLNSLKLSTVSTYLGLRNFAIY